MTLSQFVWHAALGSTCLYGWLGGGRPERVSAAAFLVVALLNDAAYTGVWRHLQHTPLALDVTLLGVLLWIALGSDRWWPLAAVAFQLVAFVARLAPVIDPWTRPLAAYVGVIGWDYLTLGALVIGTTLEVRRGRLVTE